VSGVQAKYSTKNTLQAAILLGFRPIAYQSDWIMRKNTQKTLNFYAA
jgi:hypothetical protein